MPAEEITPSKSTPANSFSIDSTHRDGTLTLRLAGRLDSQTIARQWNSALATVRDSSASRVVIDATAIDYCDGAGAAFLSSLRHTARRRQLGVELVGLRPELQSLLDLLDPATDVEKPPAKPEPVHLPEEVGRAAVRLWQDITGLVTFVGELAAALAHAAANPRGVRWRDALLAAEHAGVNALPIVALVSFLLGLIMAFQSAVPMRQFGVEIYVADLVALSMLRELGPLMTAIILAGRSGSAFAAEIGTMKVNEEINALTTMGLDPVRFLIVTRVLAAVAMMPLLTVFANLMGLIGGSIVLISMDYPLVTYVREVLGAVQLKDLLSGLGKAVVFGVLVAGIGCLRGLQTRTGASAVGLSTTSAVVSGIVLIVLADGVFSVIFYYLGI